MNPKPHMALDDDTRSATGDHSIEDEAQEKAQSKKAAFQQKCDDIL